MGQCSSSFSVLVLGLTDSGKTTLLRSIEAIACPGVKQPRAVVAPTICHDHTTARLDNGITLFFDELAANIQTRNNWAEFFPRRDALIWIIDVADPGKYTESVNLLGETLRGGTQGGPPLAESVLVVVFFNKIDIWIGCNVAGAEEAVESTIKKSIRALGSKQKIRYTWGCAKHAKASRSFIETLGEDIAEHNDHISVRVARKILS